MATPSALDNLKAAHASVCAKIADVLADPKPNYTLPGGVSVDRDRYYAGLLAREKELRAVPGVAPETNPVFTLTSVAR